MRGLGGMHYDQTLLHLDAGRAWSRGRSQLDSEARGMHDDRCSVHLAELADDGLSLTAACD